MFLSILNAEIVACILLFGKSRHKRNLKSTSKYGFFPDLGGKMAAFWACACKLSWTLLSPARPPIGGGKKGEFRDWTSPLAEQAKKCAIWLILPARGASQIIRPSIVKITISSHVIGLKMSYFPLIRFPSCYRTVCYWIVCYWTVCYRTV